MTTEQEVAVMADEIVSRTAKIRAAVRFIRAGQVPSVAEEHKRIAVRELGAMKATVTRAVQYGLQEPLADALRARGFTGALNV